MPVTETGSGSQPWPPAAAHQLVIGSDPTTGLANRATFSDRLAWALAGASAARQPVSVLIIALDDVTTVFDSLGPVVGDYVLAATGARLRVCLGARADRLARVGPTRFAVLLDGPDQAQQAVALAEDIIEVFRTPLPLPEQRAVLLGVSIGIGMSQPADRAPDALLRQAEAAVRLAIWRGRWSYAQFEPGLHTAALQRLTDAADLYRAVERQEFAVVYQPIVDLTTGALHGAEALVRWKHPQRGLVPPSDFIPAAEETGLILAIGRWVLARACRLARRLAIQSPDTAPLTISVNLSASQLLNPALVDEIAQTLRLTALAPEQLVLEITESVLVRDAAAIVGRLHDLKRLGARLALDDFGAGYSSFGYLRRLPIDILKIDRLFTSGLENDQARGSDESAVLRSIIELGHRLGLVVVSEGIETPVQARRVRELGCDLAQGYAFARPLPAPSFIEYCRARRQPA